jgi:stage IV sporulation protein FB
MLRFRLFGIPIGIHWMFLLLTAFLGGGLDAQGPEQWRMVIVFMVAAFLSILIHELGHALTGLMMGAKSVFIQLHGWGGVAIFPDARFSRFKNIVVTAAGPLASILLAGLFTVISTYANLSFNPDSQLSFLWIHFLYTMVGINIFWSIFNLCPILPLDGGQILKDILGPKRIKLTCIIGFTTLAIIGYYLWKLTGSVYNLLIIAVLAGYTWKVYRETDR